MAVLALVMAGSGCETSARGARSTAAPEPDPSRTAGLPAAQVQTGKRIYEAKCARCHKFYNPADYDPAEWHSWMTKMSKKARLTAEDKSAVSRYLDLFRPRDLK
jgi:cytochrome c5